MFAAKSIAGIVMSVVMNLCNLSLSLWYLDQRFSLRTDYSYILQIVHGVWSAILILVINIVMCYVCFGIHTTFVFRIPDRIQYLFHLLFWGLVAVTEELVFRVCFFRIFEKTHIHKLLIMIAVSFLFGMAHLYMNGMYVQFLAASIFSLLLFFFLHVIDHYTIISCISAHFIYCIFCDYLVYS